MNTENQEEVGNDSQWWKDFHAIFAMNTRVWQIESEKQIFVTTWNSGSLKDVASDADALDLEPMEAVRTVFRFLLIH